MLLLHTKSEAFSAFKHFKSWAEKQTGKLIKALRDDKGGEYMSNEWEAFMLEHGIGSTQLVLPSMGCSH